ncbi:MAG TPA: 4Fe-4S dicluster domain-containing protein [Rhizomicrobium sp.]|nr:4Fe-4S dicluster domain-containing protein [Rhizomicrobium sp.]
MTTASATIDKNGLDALIKALAGRGFRVVGPTLRDSAIVYDDIGSAKDLPEGWTDEQDGGTYRLVRRNDEALFGYAVGPHSWKKFLHPPIQSLWKAARSGKLTVHVEGAPSVPEKFALFGVRACELHAIAIQDKVFLHGPHGDPHYRARRENAFIVAVNCSKAGGTCFCVSMNTGPRVGSGFDIAITELADRGRFVVEAGTERGREVLAELPQQQASNEDAAAAGKVIEKTAASMGRHMKSDDVHRLLLANLEHPRWDDVAERCLACANCTMVCPTCFCTTVDESTDLTGTESSRTRRWDSCFTIEFSYLHGGTVRPTTRSRYRQWMTHKLATWHDQFGTSGCVGCGRCITWCPVGIDITQEVAAIRGEPT